MADKPTVLRLRKLANKSTGTRVTKYDPNTGEKRLVNPATPGDDHEPWPLTGISFVDGPPTVTTLTPDKVTEGVQEGWLTTEGATPVVRPAGATQADWNSGHTGTPHVFMHYDTVTFHTVDGDFAYKVIHQPDKYADHSQASYPDQVAAFEADDDTPVTPEMYAAGATRVDHFYVLELEA